MAIRNSVIAWAAAALPLVACGGQPEAAAPAAPAGGAASAPKAAAAAAGAMGTATVSGRILFDGTPPEPEKIKLAADPKCQHMHADGLERVTVEVRDGGLKDAFIYVKSGLTGTYPAPSQPVELDQQGCMYHPTVVAVQAGQPIKIRNSDDTLHNIHPRPKINEEFNIGQPRQGMESTKTFDKPENMIPVSCDVHPWMRSYISVVGNPFFAVSGEDGSFEIKGLPAGEYEIEALHPVLGPQTAKVTVEDGGAATVELTLAASQG